eukprot:scaffold169654_cov28-Tisochrysis_lutea.AAC.2
MAPSDTEPTACLADLDRSAEARRACGPPPSSPLFLFYPSASYVVEVVVKTLQRGVCCMPCVAGGGTYSSASRGA